MTSVENEPNAQQDIDSDREKRRNYLKSLITGLVKNRDKDPDFADYQILLAKEGLMILDRDGIEEYNKWYYENLEASFESRIESLDEYRPNYRTVFFSKMAHESGMTNSEFLREFGWHRAQGEAAREEAEKEARDKLKKQKEEAEYQKDTDFIKGKLNSVPKN